MRGRLICFGIGLALAACGRAPEGQPQPVQAVITPAGGGLEVRDAQGGALRLQLPAGAVRQDTPFTLTPLPAQDGALTAFRVEPAGLLLLERARLSYAPAGSLPARAHFFWKNAAGRNAVPTVRQGGGLEADVGVLGYPQPARLRGLAAAEAPENTLEVAVLDCQGEVAGLEARLAQALAHDDLGQAQALFDELQAVVLACQQLEVARLKQKACDAYAAAELRAQAVAADSFAAFDQLAVPLIAGLAYTQLTGAECDTGAFSAVLDAKFGQFLDFVEAEVAKPSFDAVFEAIVDRFRDLVDYHAHCQLMGLSEAVCDRFAQHLYPEVLERLREAAYRECRAEGNLLTLSQMHAQVLPRPVVGNRPRPRLRALRGGPYLDFARYTYADLEADLAHCRSELGVRVFDDAATVPVELASQQRALQGGALPGGHATAASVRVPKDGSLTLGGAVKALLCPDGSFSDDALVFRVGGAAVAQRARNGGGFTLETSPADLVLEQVLATAGLPPDTAGFTLEVFREGSACGGEFSSPFKLYEVSVEVVSLSLDGISGSPTIVYNTTENYLLFWSGNPKFPVQIKTRTLSCGVDACTFPPLVTVNSLQRPQPFPLRCTGSDDTPAGTIVSESVMVDADGIASNPLRFTVTCVPAPQPSSPVRGAGR